MSEVPGPVKMMLAALSVASTLAIGTGAYAFTTLSAKVSTLDDKREEIATYAVELRHLRESIQRLEVEMRELRMQLQKGQ